MKRFRLIALAAAALAGLAGCGGSEPRAGNDPDAGRDPATTRSPVTTTLAPLPRPSTYRPIAEESYPNAKRLAASVARQVTTYAPGATPREVVADLDPVARSRAQVARAVAPLVRRGWTSAGTVVYPQLSGMTATTAGVMVLVRQTARDRDGRTRSTARVLDVRLRREAGPWQLDRVQSVGGPSVPRPMSLTTGERRVLDHPGIALSDSARWDIHRHEVDERLLRALAKVGDRRRISISVLRSGHPDRVWGTDRRSAHSAGQAADIYAVDGRLVVRQRRAGSTAQGVARAFLAGGATQVGSPWDLAAGSRSFADPVHEDHLHVQQTELDDER